jgi:predicted DsbA family dithiol-disulfide isomerase
MEEIPRISVVHSTAPGCQWSWGYEAVVNRLKMVYGDQIDLHIRVGCPYESWDQWLIDYGMSEEEASKWMDEDVAPTTGVPLAKVTDRTPPPNMMPASLSTVAALHQGDEKGWRYQRALVRMYAVEGRDPSARATMLAAAKEAKLDAARLEKDLANEEALRAEYEEQGHRGPPVHVGFYNFIVWDGGNRRVILDYSFDPRDIEGAIDYLSGGTLTKKKPTDIIAYLKHHGLAPLSEVGRVFDFASGEDATVALEKLEKAGKLERVQLAGAPHWRATL